jgi:hypothetical protein
MMHIFAAAPAVLNSNEGWLFPVLAIIAITLIIAGRRQARREKKRP